jgi:hypothetical protein
MKRTRGLFRSGVLLFCLLASSAVESRPAAEADPAPKPGQRLKGLPGPSGTGLLETASKGAAKTYGELGWEVDRFLVEELEPARQRVAWQRSAYRSDLSPTLVPSTTWGLGYVPGGPVVLAVQPPGGWDPGPVGAAILLGLTYFTERGEANLRGCQEFLDRRGDTLRAVWESSRGVDDVPAPPELRDSVEDRMSEVRAYAPCRGQFRPAAAPPVPLRPPEGPP